jgi:hypothetical protein
MDEDEAADIGISMAATEQECEREKNIYYNTCAELSRTRIAAQDLTAYAQGWRDDPSALISQFEVSVSLLISNHPLIPHRHEMK